MATLRVFQEIDNDIWRLTFAYDAKTLSDDDQARIKKFGEPMINIGGIYLGGTDNSYGLPDKYIRVFSQFPYSQEFDTRSTDFATATKVKVEAFRDTLIASIQSAFQTLRTEVDTFTGERIFEI